MYRKFIYPTLAIAGFVAVSSEPAFAAEDTTYVFNTLLFYKLRIFSFLKGRYNQHFVDVLPMDKTPVQYLQTKNSEMPYQKIRNHLGKYGLGGHAHEILLKQCSGGQKARVVLSSLALEAPHILVLDEPTNHLDIETIDALAEGYV